MPLRNLLVALVVLCALGGAVFWSNKVKSGEEKTGSADQPKLVSITENEIGKISIKRRDGKALTLQKGDKWEMTVPEPLPLDLDAVNSLVSALGGITADRVVEENNSDWASYGLDNPVLEVTVTRRDGKQTRLLIGDEGATGSGVYARLGGENKLYLISSWHKTSLDKTAQDVRDRRLAAFDTEKLTRVELTAKGQTLEFGRNSRNEWQVVKPKPLRADNLAVEELVRKIREAKMDAAVSAEDAKKAEAAFGSGARVAVARMTDAAGAKEIEVRKKGDDYFAKGSSLPGAHKVTSELGEGLNKGLDDFRNKKPFEFGFNDPSRIEIKGQDGQTKVLERKDAKWMLSGKEMDSVAVQSLIDRLRELSATSFPETGFGAAVLEMKVTANEGKITDEVRFAKSGDKYVAQRANEPVLYGFDTAVFDGIQQAITSIREPAPPAKDEKKK